MAVMLVVTYCVLIFKCETVWHFLSTSKCTLSLKQSFLLFQMFLALNDNLVMRGIPYFACSAHMHVFMR